ncbi:Dabb family protein [Octadecabacter ascidiaceicola]|uniref:Stress responsive A/B Barrel Domain protein n=1 Tax=Octadecabacter ascidiaceicola TaxID=1655543 RepID=A0A238K8Q3_9RHOB|nr:Dabb family protein [Octadecabacter ascidiaceicola]SMX39278.1 Stress responsive A/B Barrel Domain protein [Octadecabacter ascidiaceicola]
MPDRSFIRHVVLFSAKDKTDVARIVDGLSMLADIPHSSVFEVVQNSQVDALSGEIDVVVYAEFVDDAALQAYKSHPIYQDAIDVVRPLREMRIAADF